MLIFRLETIDKKGIYQSGLTSKSKEWYQGNNTKHPAPWDDSLFNENCKKQTGHFADEWGSFFNFVFGFSSPAQVLRWFYNLDDLKYFEENGIKINVYESKTFIEGNTQIAFHKSEHTTPVKTYLPTEFYAEFGTGQKTN